MTYFEIMQQPGREIHPKLYYYDSTNSKVEIDQDDLEAPKLFFNCTLTGTVMRGLEVSSKIVLPEQTAIYFQNTAKFETNRATKTYGPYFIKESSYNADDKTYDYTLYDDFLNAMVDYKPITINYPTTVLNFFKQLCVELGYTTSITSLPNGSRVMSMDIYDGIGFTYRDVFDDIGNATATLFKISNKDVQKCTLGTDEIPVDDDLLKNQNISLGEHFGPINSIVLSRSGESDNIYKRDETLTSWNEWKIVDNQLMNDNNRSDYLDELYNALHGIEYDIFDLELVGYGGFDPLAKVKITTNNNTSNSYVFNNEIEFDQGVSESIYTELPEQSETDYKSASDTDKKINQTYIIANKNTQQIQSLVSQVGDRSEKQTTITQDIDSISQQVSQSITLTKDVSNISYVTLEDAIEANVSKLSIVGEMSLLYPSDDLYPSNDLYPLDSYLVIEDEDGNKNKVLLPLNYLHYLNATTYDEFVVENGQAKIIRRVGENDDGSLYALTAETVEDKGACEIQLNTGYNKIYLESFSDKSLRYNLKYVYQNDYTDTFATNLELNTTIEQTATNINLSVNQKLESYSTTQEMNAAIELSAIQINLSVNQKLENYSTTQEMNAAIELSASQINLSVSNKVDKDEVIAQINLTSETAKIIASKIQFEGLVTANNNFKILTDGSMEAVNGKFSGTITASSGTIGGASIDSQGVFFNSGNNGWGLWGTTAHANIVLHAGANSSNIGGAPFRVLTDGTLYATKANITGAISATTISCTNGTFAGWSVSGSGLSGDRLGLNTSTGQITVFPVSGGGYIISNGLRLSASAGAAISSNSNGSVAAPSSGLDLKGCSGATVYIGCMVNAAGTTEASCLSVENGAVNMRGGTFYVNGTPVGSSSSRAMKKNIRLLKDEEKEDIYEAIKEMNLYHYDFKSKYINGLKDNFGFIIEDIEDTILKRTLHVKQDEKDENVKYYSDGDLIRTLLIVVQQLQEKVEKLGG